MLMFPYRPKAPPLDSPPPKICNCIGPQHGQPHCPCLMHGKQQAEAAMRQRVVAELIAQGWKPPLPRVRVKAAGVEA